MREEGMLFMAVALVLFLNIFSDQSPPVVVRQSEPVQEVHVGVAKKELETTRRITICYDVRFDSIYTGAATYIPYKGTKEFVVPRDGFVENGFKFTDPAAGIWIDRATNKQLCCETFKVLIPSCYWYDSERNNITARCSEPMRITSTREADGRGYILGLFSIETRIIKKDEDNFILLMAPTKEEVETMSADAGLKS